MRYTEIYEAITKDLMEVKMSPNRLRQAAKLIGGKAGMEFEMIVPGVPVNDDTTLEPDYDMDERPDNIDEIVSFFDDGNYNTRREVRDLEGDLRRDYQEWVDENLAEDFNGNSGTDYEDWYADQHPEIEEDDELEAAAKESWNSEDYDFDNFKEQWMDEHRDDYDEQDWLRHEGIRSMQQVERNYDITWPHYRSVDQDNEIAEVARSFELAVGRNTIWSLEYHGETRDGRSYIVEPDGSLEGDSSNDGGWEFVSPPLDVTDMIADLRDVVTWAKRYGCYTNESTGLHMNVSIPAMASGQLDYVKLALFLGDEYILREFGRLGNHFATSALSKLRTQLAAGSNLDVGRALDAMRKGMVELGGHIVKGRVGADKYTSIHEKRGYIEFRSPGGDWLNTDLDDLESTLLRMVVALDIACDPNKYRREYAKKLYSLLASSTGQNNDAISIFSNYNAGIASKDEVITVLRSRRGLEQDNQAATRYLKRQKEQYGIVPTMRPGYGLAWFRVDPPNHPHIGGKVFLWSGDPGERFDLHQGLTRYLAQNGLHDGVASRFDLGYIESFDPKKLPPR